MIFFKKLYWTFFRKKHGYPSQEEILFLFSKYKNKLNDRLKPYQVAIRYGLIGQDIEYIADIFHCTRERIRQILWKARRQLLEEKKDYE